MPNPQHAIRSLLKNDFERRRQRNSSFSKRAYARYMNIAPSAISEILSGFRPITRRMGERILIKLQKDQPQSVTLLEALKNKNARSQVLESCREQHQIEDAQFELLSSWKTQAVFVLLEGNRKLLRFKTGILLLSQTLGLPKSEISHCIDTLMQLGLIKVNLGGKAELKSVQISTTSEIKNLAQRRSLSESLEFAQRQLDQIPIPEREFGQSTLSIDPSLLPQVKTRLQNFHKEMTSWLESQPKRRSAYRLSIQFFPLREPGPERSQI